MKKFKLFTLIASLVLTAVLTITLTQTGAWFTDAKNGGSVSITVGGDVTINVTAALNTEETAVLPGDEISLGTATITSAAGNSACILRAKLTYSGTGVTGVAEPTTITGWEKHSSNGYWYYGKATFNDKQIFGQSVDANNTAVATASLALGTVTVATDATETTLIPGNTATIALVVEAIQARNLTEAMFNSTDAWATAA